ncbi:cytochrome P450 [Spongiactinospora rosea]|uniref:cytochrome P450 n=1 Tax=Spongiactinospora rosea TaxID=2248750 RepID=UPI0013147E38|nr:cytochrome P450 [Spongiactinospora rosea]
MTSDRSWNIGEIRHPLNQDAQGVNRPPLDINPLYHHIRETPTGVATVQRASGPAFLITRWEDVRFVLQDPRFSREHALDADDVPGLAGTLLGMDPPEHTELRRLVSPAFTARAVAQRRPELVRQGDRFLKEMIDQGDYADLMKRFALPFALNTICDLLGLPEEDREAFYKWSMSFLATSDATREEARASGAVMAEYLGTLIEQRRQRPADGLLSHIAAHAQNFPPEQVIMLPIALFIGGWETTAGNIGTFVQVLLSRPYLEYESGFKYLVRHPEMLDGAVTELERMFSNAAADGMPRRVMDDVRLPGGGLLKAGDVVIPSMDAANHDARAFDAPQRLDFARATEGRGHLSFGHGTHYCIGRHLGHEAVVIAIGLLVQYLPELRLAVAAESIPRKFGHAVTGPIELPVTWR